MSEAFADAIPLPGDKAKLSARLIEQSAKGQNYLGFISYRRGDALPLARWLRSRITSFRPPAELKDKIDAIDASVGGPQNRVFFDMSYQKPNVDFWDEHIGASLCRSRTLILLQTASVFDRLDTGEPNWCEREIETFLSFYGDPSRVLVVMGPSAPIDRFPAPLERISERWDWIDFRSFSESPFVRLRQAGHYDPLLAKILAKIYDISDGDLPLLNREFAKGRARVRRAMAAAAGATIVSLSVLSGWALMERSRATAAEQVALQERDTAIKQRNAALVSQSRFLAKTADGFVKDGTARAAIAILREALPDPVAGRQRPLVEEAVVSAYHALYNNREIERMTLPAGTTAVATSGDASRIIFATADRLLIRKGAGLDQVQDWPHDFGPVQSLSLSPAGDRIVMVSPAGAVMIRNLADNAVVFKDAGSGPGTHVVFLSEGTRVLVTDAARRNLKEFDLATGKEIAKRALESKNGKPLITLFDNTYLAYIADDRLTRLSIDDLGDGASLAITDATQYAMALSPDKSTLYVAAAQEFLAGRMLALDPATLAIQRSFGRIGWGARSLIVSPKAEFLALNSIGGVDFFDLKSFDTIGHVPTAPLTGGRFVKNGLFFVGFNQDGAIHQITPDNLNEVATYTTIDGGAIQSIDALPDDSGFLSISDKPSITHWSYDATHQSKELAIPWVIKSMRLRDSSPVSAISLHPGDDTLVADHAGMGLFRWDLNRGTSVLVREPGPTVEEQELLAALGKGITLVASGKTGGLDVYADKTGPAKPAGHIDLAPARLLLGVSEAAALDVTTSNEPYLVDLADPEKPIARKLAKLGECKGSGAGPDLAICTGPDGHLRGLRISDDTIVLDMPLPAGGLNAADIAPDGKSFLFADTKGHIEWRRLAGGTGDDQWLVKTNLSGPRLKSALATHSLSAEDDAAARIAGTTSIEVVRAPVLVRLSPDNKTLAAVLPDGGVQIIPLQSHKAIEIPGSANRIIAAMQFSAHGQLLAVLDCRTDPEIRSPALAIYNVETGMRLFSINLYPKNVPYLFPMSDGRGFVTVNPSEGKIRVHPAFETLEDLVAYMTEKFPERLTPANRHFFFIE